MVNCYPVINSWQQEGVGRRSKIRKAVGKLLLFREKGPSYSQHGLIDIHGLDCANSDGWGEGLQHSYRFLTIGNFYVKFKFFSLIWCLFLEDFKKKKNPAHLKSHVKSLIHKQLGAGWGDWGSIRVYCEVLVSDWLFLVDCSKAVQLLLDIIIAARIKWLIWQQICQIPLLAKYNIYVYILTLKSSSHYFLFKSFICSLYNSISSHQKVAVPSLHMNKIQTRLLYINKTQIDSRCHPVFFYRSQLYNSVHKNLSNKIKTHRQGIVSHSGLLYI